MPVRGIIYETTVSSQTSLTYNTIHYPHILYLATGLWKDTKTVSTTRCILMRRSPLHELSLSRCSRNRYSVASTTFHVKGITGTQKEENIARWNKDGLSFSWDVAAEMTRGMCLNRASSEFKSVTVSVNMPVC